MGQTDVFELPYPEPPDPDDVPTDMRELADAVDALLAGGRFTPPLVTPAQMGGLAPFDGMRIRLLVDAATGIEWELAYRAGSPNPEKWEFLGGPNLGAVELAEVGITTLNEPNQLGPPIYAPRPGIYEIGARGTFSDGGGGIAGLSPMVDGVMSAAASYVLITGENVTAVYPPGNQALAAGQPVWVGVYVTVATNSRDRGLLLRPVRLS